jgi:hypothetical protein
MQQQAKTIASHAKQQQQRVSYYKQREIIVSHLGGGGGHQQGLAYGIYIEKYCKSLPHTPSLNFWIRLQDQGGIRKNCRESTDKVKQRRVLGRDNVGRRSLSEEDKDKDAEPKESFGPGMLFLGNRLRWTVEWEAAFQNVLNKCGGILFAAPVKLLQKMEERGDKAKRFKCLTRIVKDHLKKKRNQEAGPWRLLNGGRSEWIEESVAQQISPCFSGLPPCSAAQ